VRPIPRSCLTFVTVLYGEELLARGPTPKLEDHLLSAGTIFYSVYSQLRYLHNQRPSPSTTIWGRAMTRWQMTHITRSASITARSTWRVSSLYQLTGRCFPDTAPASCPNGQQVHELCLCVPRIRYVLWEVGATLQTKTERRSRFVSGRYRVQFLAQRTAFLIQVFRVLSQSLQEDARIEL